MLQVCLGMILCGFVHFISHDKIELLMMTMAHKIIYGHLKAV